MRKPSSQNIKQEDSILLERKGHEKLTAARIKVLHSIFPSLQEFNELKQKVTDGTFRKAYESGMKGVLLDDKDVVDMPKKSTDTLKCPICIGIVQLPVVIC